ncbi:MAG: hypothetical protein JOZ52_10280 [Acidobacteria bacterium]|nr:hypothetical protein [Acidobacteriota bacterium]
MAEERNLGVARAPETDEDYTKAELQRRMEEARESITQTVTEIKDTVAQSYNSVKESVTDALDWREQFRKRPVAWTVGALGVGLVVGYSLGGAIIPERDEDDYEGASYPQSDETDAFAKTGASPARTSGMSQSAFADHRSYAQHAHAIEGGAYGSTEYAAAAPSQPQAAPQTLASPRPSYSSGYDQAPAAEAEEDKPGLIERVKESGLIERFKESRAYDRLQEEVSDLGNRFMDELSNAARTIVLPALFNKIKELVGVDLSNKQASGATTSGGRQALASNQTRERETTSNQSEAQTPSASSQSNTASTANAGTASSGASDSRSKFDRLAGDESASSRGGISYDDRYERESQLYARSENRGFGTPARGGKEGGGTDTPANREDTGRGGQS